MEGSWPSLISFHSARVPTLLGGVFLPQHSAGGESRFGPLALFSKQCDSAYWRRILTCLCLTEYQKSLGCCLHVDA